MMAISLLGTSTFRTYSNLPLTNRNRSSNNYDEMKSVEVNLDNKIDKDKPPAYRIIIRKAKTINLQVLQNWLQKKGSFDERVLEALNFMDHLLREWPSSQYTPVKRAFYDAKEQPHTFDSTLDLYKGFYQAIRPAFVSDPSILGLYARVSNRNIGWKTCRERRQRALRILATAVPYQPR